MSPRGAVPVAAVLLLTASACIDSFRPEFVDSIRLSRDSVHVSVGGTAIFRAFPVSEGGREMPERAERVQWTVDRPDVATIEQDGDILNMTALKLGTARVTARLGRGLARGNVYVQPPGLVRIAITPDRVEVSPGERPRVEAHLFDAQDNELAPEGFRISWEILDRRIGFVGTPTGPRSDLLAFRIGTTAVKLIVGRLSTQVPFIVQ